MRRRPYLLLEVVIALSLATLCALPLLRPIFAATRHEHQLSIALQQQLTADQAFTEVRQLLYDNQIPWTAIRGGEKRPQPYCGQLPNGFTFEIAEQTKFRKHTNTGETGANYRLLAITLSRDGKSYAYQLFAERIYPNVET